MGGDKIDEENRTNKKHIKLFNIYWNNSFDTILFTNECYKINILYNANE